MNKKNLTLVIIVVVICAAAISAYALVRPGTNRERTIPVPERVASTSIPFALYENPTLGVTFSRPQAWTDVPGDTIRLESPDFAEEAIPGTEQKRVTAGAALSVSKEPFLIDNADEYVSLITDFHEDPECGNCLTGHAITVAGVPTHLGFASDGTSSEPKGAIISFVTGGNLYRILMSFAEYTPENEEILAEVIGTFVVAE